MLRLYVHAYSVPVARRSANESIIEVKRFHYFLTLNAVLIRVHFKIKIVENPYRLPKISFIAIAELFRIPAHYIADNASVLQMKLSLIIFIE